MFMFTLAKPEGGGFSLFLFSLFFWGVTFLFSLLFRLKSVPLAFEWGSVPVFKRPKVPCPP